MMQTTLRSNASRRLSRPGATVISALALVFLCTLLSPPPIRAADPPKIGVVDLQKILEVSEAAKAGQESMRKEVERMEAEGKKSAAEAEDLKSRLDREAMVMSKEAREEKEREFRIKLSDLKALEKKYRDEIQQLKGKLINEIYKDVSAILEEIGKKDGYQLIIEKREAGVFYAPKTIDLTDRLLQEFNSRHGKKKP
jgi:outer membrane protein